MLLRANQPLAIGIQKEFRKSKNPRSREFFSGFARSEGLEPPTF